MDIDTDPRRAQGALETVKQFRIIFLVTVITVLTGSTFYHFVEGWKWLDAVYFSVVSLATVGYGDLAPKTDIGKLFTIFYLIIGIGIFAALLNNLLKSRLAKRSLRHLHIDADREVDSSRE